MKSKCLRAAYAGLLFALAGCGGGGYGGGAGTPTPSYSVGVTVTGLTGSGLQLKNGSDTLSVAANGPSTFATSLPSGTAYSVTVLTQPTVPAQTCAVANGSGSIANGNITDIAVSCVTSTAARFAYSLNFGDGSLSIYNVDAASGQLRMRGYAKTGAGPSMAVHDAAGKFTYVLNSGLDPLEAPPRPFTLLHSSISVFAHDNVNGELREVDGSPFITSEVPVAATFLTVHRSGKFVYVTNSFEDVIRQWSVTPKAGLVAIPGEFGGFVATGIDPSQLVFDPLGRFAYVANRGSSDLYVYEIDTVTGALQEREALRTKVSARALRGLAFAFHPSGKFAYVVNQERDSTLGSLAAFAVNAVTGELTAINGAPYTLPANPAPAPLLFHPSGKFAYARVFGAPDSPGSIAGFSIDATTGALTSLANSPYAVGINPGSLTFTPSGQFLYAANDGPSTPTDASSTGSISAFSIDATTGVLTAIAGIETLQPAPRVATVDPSGQYLYAVSTRSDRLYAFRIDAASGALSALPQAAVIRTGNQPISIDAFVSPTLATPVAFQPRFAYAADMDGLSVSSYAIDAGSGLLTPSGTIPASGAAPRALAPSQDGRFLYSVQSSENVSASNVSMYSIDTATGTLTEIDAGTVPTGARPIAIAVDPSRRFAYVANYADNTVTSYRLDAKTGRLTVNGSVTPTVAEPLAMAIDPTGRNLYVMSFSKIQTFSITAATGTLSTPATADDGVKILVTGTAAQLAVEPGGKFLYVVSPDSSVERYPIDPRSGALGAVSRQITERGSLSLSIDPTGRFFYAADWISPSVSAFSIDQQDGALTPLGVARVPIDPRHVVADFSGRYLYALLFDNTVAGFSIDPVSGELGAIAGTSPVTGINTVSLVTVGEVR